MAKYSWIKLEDHFFDDDEMVMLRSQKNGYEYIYLWQRLLLKCLKNSDKPECGMLRLNDKVPYSPEILADIFKMNIDTVRVGIEIFERLGMVEILEDETIYIEAVNRIIGKSGESTERVRKLRDKRKQIEIDAAEERREDIEKSRVESNVSCNVTKDKYMEHVFLSKEEYKELTDNYYQEDIDTKIAWLNCEIANKNSKYTYKDSHFAILAKFFVTDVMAGKIKKKPKKEPQKEERDPKERELTDAWIKECRRLLEERGSKMKTVLFMNTDEGKEIYRKLKEGSYVA